MSELKDSDLVASSRREGTGIVASIKGEIDLHNSPEFREVLLDCIARLHPAKLILNLAQVPYMDSSGLAVLVETMQKLRKISGKIFLTDLQPRVRGVLEIAKLDTVFVLVKDEKEAMEK
jgi:anti-sigma B factor antagonist